MVILTPVQEAITGDEDLSELAPPVRALAQFYCAFNRRDLSLMEQNWDNSEEAAMDNPLGGIKRGWNQIRKVYERIFDNAATVRLEFFDYTLHIIHDVFYAVGRERGRVEAREGTLSLAIRSTRVFRRMASGQWRQVHYHGSIDDPQLLAAYQAALR
jgi:ketosteroid isomerase-like protein